MLFSNSLIFQDSDVETVPKVTFAPQDINPIDFKSKTNQHGLGYSGMSRLQPAAHSAFGTKQFLQRKTIRGQVLCYLIHTQMDAFI